MAIMTDVLFMGLEPFMQRAFVGMLIGMTLGVVAVWAVSLLTRH